MNRYDISSLIIQRFNEIGIKYLKEKYEQSGKINHLIIEKVLPNELATNLSEHFPQEKELNHLIGPQENKYVGVHFTDKQKLVEECIYAFQEENLIQIISEITNIKTLIGDPELYAGGISSMSKGCFLNPHIDNSHDRNMENFRRLNLLYYVNNEWHPKEDGGELVLYPNGIKHKEEEIACNFNRLVIMRTDNRSLHGVKIIKSESQRRKCISNYYFSKNSPTGKNYYHSTSFRGFKREFVKGSFLKLNALSRTFAKRLIHKLTKYSVSTGYHRKK
ncbi:MAG: 2OG-Fe(II) oxygenase [Prochlorococcus marinus CUG1439]|uniref:2OG-Fe(II) oxygenase n=1 Tax=Prochlorococcus sp. MIT 1314 TaxID=3096220 RepID=UPI001B061FF7|nr:2OG-Fe(II) oxygenase [Prochlorococcus sp. MIT 1314]MCR8540496.1 2OG-Fe(II) oxygenase [Prochlorococcus marinus CUG1439]